MPLLAEKCSRKLTCVASFLVVVLVGNDKPPQEYIMADFLGTAVGSIVIPALVFAVGLTFKKDNLTIAKVFIISAVCWTITTIVVDQFNPIMKRALHLMTA